jgi:hypothetical protein
MAGQFSPATLSMQMSGMYTPNLETILAARPHDTIGQPQPVHAGGIERVNSPREKAAMLARLTIQLAMLGDEQEACDGHA